MASGFARIREHLPGLLLFKASYYTLFSLYEFTIQVLIKVFNEVISTQGHMLYFLFFLIGVFRKVYTTYILFSKLYEFSPLTRFLSYGVNRGNNHYMMYHFILIFPLGLKEF
jgi:hypothetical protein